MTVPGVGSRVLIVGLGSSGVAAACLAAADGARVRVTDSRPESDLHSALEQLPSDTATFLGDHPETCLEGVDLMVVSPGVDATAPIVARAQSRGIEVMTEVEFAWRHRPDAPLAAVTGSNGKSTVTVLIALMLTASGISTRAGGNLAPPASELILEGGWDSWVLEISSFQAELLTAMRPRVALLLNLSQDHLERHPTMDAYLEAKRRLFAFQRPDDTAVLNRDDPASAGSTAPSRRLLFSLTQPAHGWLDGNQLVVNDEPLITADRVALSGRHNLANVLAAALAADELGGSRSAMVNTLEGFEGLHHRHRTVHLDGGVRWVNDSKATNVGAALAALGGYADGSVHLILGGLGKGQDFSPLKEVVEHKVAAVYLIGQDADRIATALGDAARIERCGTLSEAAQRARVAARSGQTVLLAPACASFDQFSGYAERGDSFAALAREEVSPCP